MHGNVQTGLHPSKDDLIVAYLDESNRQFWAWLDSAVDGIDDPGERLLGMLAAIERLATSPHCLGCTFQSTAAESQITTTPGIRSRWRTSAPSVTASPISPAAPISTHPNGWQTSCC